MRRRSPSDVELAYDVALMHKLVPATVRDDTTFPSGKQFDLPVTERRLNPCLSMGNSEIRIGDVTQRWLLQAMRTCRQRDLKGMIAVRRQSHIDYAAG